MYRAQPIGSILLRMLLCAGLAAAVAGCSPHDPQADVTASEWRFHGQDAKEQRFSALQQIRADNVQQLGLEWSIDLPGETALEATPLAVGGVLYFSGSFGKVYAVDAVGGKMLWEFDPRANEKVLPSTPRLFGVNRGVAYWDGLIFVATRDCRMIALDAKTGKQRWSTSFLVPGTNATSSGAPRVFKDKVIIGNSGAERNARGYVTTFDARTGKILWRFFVVPGDPAKGFESPAMAMAAKTWSGEWWKYGGGGTPWNGITYDEELDQVYIGTGNGGPYDYPGRMDGKKDNLFLASVVALDPDTGQYKWHYQYNPLEVWDWKATPEMILADLKVNGKARKVLMQAPSNGFFYVIDRTTGKPISAEKIGKVNWADRIDLTTGRPVERAGIRYEDKPAIIYPSAAGAHNWQASSYNPQTGLIYIPYIQLGMKVWRSPEASAKVRDNRSGGLTGIGINMELYADPKDPLDGKGSLLAWDPAEQKLRWRVDYPSMWNAGTMTTAGNLVFQGTQLGQFYAYHAASGKRLWSFDAKHGILAPPVTYSVGGKQYISLLVGYGGAGGGGGKFFQKGWQYGTPRRLLTFALGGAAKLPPTPPATFKVQPLDEPTVRLDPEQVRQGSTMYHLVCTACHGEEAEASGGAPDLRASPAVLDRELFRSILVEGLLVPNGMPKFGMLTDDQIEQIRQYVRHRAQQGLKSSSSHQTNRK